MGWRGMLLLASVLFAIGTWGYAITHPSYQPTAGIPPLINITMPDQTFALHISAFEDGGAIPATYTCDGPGGAPAVEWSGVPEGTQSLALVMEDPDVPKALVPSGLFVHWVLVGIRPESGTIAEGEAVGIAGKNSAGNDGYAPPCPPKGYEPSAHRYIFTLYALDILPTFEAPPTKDELITAMQGHILAQASYTGRYQRP